MILRYDQYFLYKPLFPSSQPSKPLKSSPRYQNLPGESFTAHSDQKTAKIYQKTTKHRPMLIFVSFMKLY